MHDPWMDRLSEYLDEGLDRSERESLEVHLRSCTECETVLADLKAVRARARRLESAPVPAEIWPRIEGGIARRRNIPFPTERIDTRGAGPGRGARFSFSLPELVAACLAIAILSGGSVFALLKVTEPGSRAPQTSVARAPELQSPPESAPAASPGTERESAPPVVTAVPATRTEVQTVSAQTSPESPHEEAIAELRKALAKHRERLDPGTIRTLESNLAIIDLAIDQARRALAADPANTYVKEHLAETMRRKVELLQRATMLASASPEEPR